MESIFYERLGFRSQNRPRKSDEIEDEIRDWMGRERKQENSSTDNLGMGSKCSRCCMHGNMATSWIGKVRGQKEGREDNMVCVCKPYRQLC